jgi:hypothetical protein
MVKYTLSHNYSGNDARTEYERVPLFGECHILEVIYNLQQLTKEQWSGRSGRSWQYMSILFSEYPVTGRSQCQFVAITNKAELLLS